MEVKNKGRWKTPQTLQNLQEPRNSEESPNPIPFPAMLTGDYKEPAIEIPAGRLKKRMRKIRAENTVVGSCPQFLDFEVCQKQVVFLEIYSSGKVKAVLQVWKHMCKVFFTAFDLLLFARLNDISCSKLDFAFHNLLYSQRDLNAETPTNSSSVQSQTRWLNNNVTGDLLRRSCGLIFSFRS